MEQMDIYSFDLVFQLLNVEDKYKIIKFFSRYECFKENITSTINYLKFFCYISYNSLTIKIENNTLFYMII